MKTLTSCLVLLLLITSTAMAQNARDAAELTNLLNDFLAGASRNDAAVHDRFWAEDLIYTRSAGRRVTKAEIMRDVRSAPAPKPDDPKVVYTAEDIRIQQYGDTAVVAFRLVATTHTGETKQVQHLLNCGTFVKRNGKWQVVAWQATRIPRTEEETKTDVAAVTAAFDQALIDRDVKKLRALTDPSFVLIDNDRETSWQLVLDGLPTALPKTRKEEVSRRTISVYGDTAVVRSESTRETDAGPATVQSTMILVNQGAGWKIVALHSSN